MKPNKKQKVIDSAVELFNAKGFDGTSVRDIAARAEVNVALISYYFGGKRALLENLMTSFYEGYISEIESSCEKLDDLSASEVLFEVIHRVLDYQQKHEQLARFAHREVTFDSTLVREVMTTYLMKEKYYYEKVFRMGIKRKEFHRRPIDFLVLQLRESLLMPYLHPQYIREVYHLMPQEAYFKKRYARYLEQWVDTSICAGEKPEFPKNNKVVAEA
ncbi:MAG TPA: forespore capture DNA-binding protein RefZ [Bacillales bacterium]|nr:forespore capture DNA-binding protein RefZ [Bacillales bacterium]HEU5140995.1 forespore capture DNA-binding protein RefZ [Bacillales bacterium]